MSSGHYDTDYIFVHESEETKRKKSEIDDAHYKMEGLKQQNLDILGKKRRAMEKYEGRDDDRDKINDAREIEVGLHSLDNIHRAGPTTPRAGTAYVGNGGINFQYDGSIADLRVRGNPQAKVHQMREPRKMKLSIDFGNKMDCVSSGKGFSVDVGSVHPELYRMNSGKIKGGVKSLKISSVLDRISTVSNGHQTKMNTFAKKYSEDYSAGRKHEEKHKEINDLSDRLTGFVHGQKVQKKKASIGIDLNVGSNLDFSIVGIRKKKKGGII